jgi:rubrerythrin
MEIEKFLSLGTDLEIQISGLYEKISTLTHDNAISKQLIKISREELTHASTLKMGKSYLKEAPDIFHGVNIDEKELNQGLKECRELYDQIKPNSAVLPFLKSTLNFEKRFEKIHLGVSVIVSDAHLKQLFQALASGDQNHIKALQEMISALEAH